MDSISKLLALETTNVSGSVALCEDGHIVASRVLDPKQRSAQSLAPAIQSMLVEYGWEPSDVDVVAVATGPGSFTGLRVGVATAKTFAWAVGARIVGIDTLDAIVARFCNVEKVSTPTIFSAGVDAQRGDAAVRSYLLVPSQKGSDSSVVPLAERFNVTSMKQWLGSEPQQLFVESLSDEARMEFDRALEKTPEHVAAAARALAKKDILFAGPALSRVRDVRSTHSSLEIVPEDLWDPEASGVALLGWARAVQERFDDVWNILPVYSRRAAAEEKALEKQRILAEAEKRNK